MKEYSENREENVEDQEEYSELDRVCGNCACYHSVRHFNFEHGVCLRDEVFEKYAEDILEENYDKESMAPCLALMKDRKVTFEKEPCEFFEEPEIIEIPDELAEELRPYIESGELTPEFFEQLILAMQVSRVDLATLPVGPYLENLNGDNEESRKEAVTSLGSLAVFKNEEALRCLCEYYRGLPPAEFLDQVHFKMQFMHFFESLKRPEVLDCLVDELEKTPATRTTRQLINEIFKILAMFPASQTAPHLERLLKEGKFTHRRKRQIKWMLDRI